MTMMMMMMETAYDFASLRATLISLSIQPLSHLHASLCMLNMHIDSFQVFEKKKHFSYVVIVYAFKLKKKLSNRTKEQKLRL